MVLFRRGPGRVDVREAAARTAPDGDAVLLDVREPDEWNAGHAPHAVHLTLAALTAGAELPSTAHGRPPVVICRSGNRSRRAAEILVRRGVDAVDVIGGMRAWAEAGLPVVDRRGDGGSIA
ncbi:rhodanese-like domain-containing protein [Streptomyces sp. NPDC002845]